MDLDFILAQEWRDDVAGFVTRWEKDKHVRLMADPDWAYLIAEEEDGSKVGYAILCGLNSTNRSIELARIVVARTDRGLGSKFMGDIKSFAFDEGRAHRLWLDLFPDNHRARRAYEKAGFVEEGVLREAYFHNGQFKSLVIMSVLEDEYRA